MPSRTRPSSHSPGRRGGLAGEIADDQCQRVDLRTTSRRELPVYEPPLTMWPTQLAGGLPVVARAHAGRRVEAGRVQVSRRTPRSRHVHEFDRGRMQRVLAAEELRDKLDTVAAGERHVEQGARIAQR